MKKTFFILNFLVFWLICLNFSTYGALTDGIIAYYSFDADDCNDDANINGLDCYENGSVSWVNTCKLNNCQYFANLDNNYLSIKDHVAFNAGTRCIFAWVNFNDTSSETDTIYKEFYGGNAFYLNQQGYYNALRIQSTDDGSNYNNLLGSTSPLTEKIWYHLGACHLQGTGAMLYVNGVNTQNATTRTGALISPTNFITIGVRQELIEPMYGYIDELAIYNRSLSEAEALQLYNSGTGYNPFGSTAGKKPSLTLYSDLVNGTITNTSNFNFYFNGSSVNNSNIYSCGIFSDGISKNSFSNTDISSNKNLSFTLSGEIENWYNFTINCYNENASSNVSALYYIDTKKSVLNYAFPNGTYYNNEALYTNFSVTDTNLYSIEWLVYQGATLKENISHVGIKGVTTYDVYNLSTLSQITGSYNWILNVWENHNPLTSANLFTEFDAKTTESKIVYEYAKQNYSITSFQKMSVTSETKDLKQYFEFTLDKAEIPQKEYTYYLEYAGKLDYIENSQYKAHFVLFDIKRYVDFQCNDYVKVNRINPNKYQIITPCTKFETTGNLNFQQWTGNFNITTPPSLSDTYLLLLIEQAKEGNENLINIYEVLKMLGFILSNALFLVIIRYVTKPIHEKLYFLAIVPTINLILASFLSFGIDILDVTISRAIVSIGTLVMFLLLIILYAFGLLVPQTRRSEQKTDIYSQFK